MACRDYARRSVSVGLKCKASVSRILPSPASAAPSRSFRANRCGSWAMGYCDTRRALYFLCATQRLFFQWGAGNGASLLCGQLSADDLFYQPKRSTAMNQKTRSFAHLCLALTLIGSQARRLRPTPRSPVRRLLRFPTSSRRKRSAPVLPRRSSSCWSPPCAPTRTFLSRTL